MTLGSPKCTIVHVLAFIGNDSQARCICVYVCCSSTEGWDDLISEKASRLLTFPKESFLGLRAILRNNQLLSLENVQTLMISWYLSCIKFSWFMTTTKMLFIYLFISKISIMLELWGQRRWTERKTADAFASEHSTVVVGRELMTHDGQSGEQFQLTDRRSIAGSQLGWISSRNNF